MRQSHSGTQRGQVDLHSAGIHGVLVRLKGGPGPLHPSVQVGDGLLVHREDAVFGSRLNGHITDGESIVHLQGGHAISAELQGLIQSSIHPDHADEVEHHVLATDIGGESSGELDLNGLGHLEPGKTGGHARRHIGGAHASGESAQSAISTGVGVCANDDLTGGSQALLGNQGVLNAHLAHIVEVGDVVLVGKVPAPGAQLGGLDVLTGGGVVQHNGDLVLVKHRGQPRLLKLFDGHGCGNVVAQHQVQLAL